jgi:SET domain-containing protein
MPACDGELHLKGVSDRMKIQVRVGTSRIAGQGLFAAQDISKGTRIMQYIGEKISSRERARRLATSNAYIFHLTYRYAIDGQTLENTARYINHACDPNCEVEKTSDTIWIIALREITSGEELTYNYTGEGKNPAGPPPHTNTLPHRARRPHRHLTTPHPLRASLHPGTDW